MRMIGRVLVFAVVLAACSSTSSEPPSAADTSAAAATTAADSTVADSAATHSTVVPEPERSDPTTTPAVIEQRWIVRDGTRFVDTRTGTPFVPRGVNLLAKPSGGGADALFVDYDPDWVDQQLDAIAGLGFDTVRFFIDQCRPCTSDAVGVRADFLDDLADLLTRLEAHGLVGLPTSNDVPDLGFSDRLPCCEPFGGYRNSLYLSAEGHEIASEYWSEIVNGVKERGAPTHHLLGWQLTNEQFVLRDVPPLSSNIGTVVAADGRSYDLADDGQVEQMVINSLLAYIDKVGDTVRAVDEGALVTMGFFSAEEPDAGRVARDNRWTVPQHVIHTSSLDFVDLHAYPGLGGRWDVLAAAFGIDDVEPTVPMILGEFGAFEAAYGDVDEAAAAMAQWQAASCDVGFQGWLLWFWGAERDDEVYPVNIDDAAIARATTAAVRPDPCDVGPFASTNLALGAPVAASAEESAEYAAGKAVDGSEATWWSAANGPPQWIEIDLGVPSAVGAVEISIGFVTPTGPQNHRVSLRGDGGVELAALDLAADATAGDVLVADFEMVPDVRTVRVDTTALDGWVILHEIRVLRAAS